MKRLIIVFTLLGSLLSCGSGQKSQSANMINGHEYVDLGLPSGLKWATCNIGASSPEEYGGIYDYGNIEPIKDGHPTKMDLPDGLDISGDPDYDAATADWGGSWRMPTYEEMLELGIYCTQEFIEENGISGLKITGPNGNHIFLPDNTNYHAKSGFANVFKYNTNGTADIVYAPDGYDFLYGPGSAGACIRPVSGKKTISPMVQHYLNYEKVSQASYLVCNFQDVSEDIDFKWHNPVTLKYLYIHSGYPKKNYRSILGSSIRIEIDDEIVTVDEIKDHYYYHRDRYPDSEWDDIYVIICADRDTRMGLIEDIIYELRKSGCPSDKIVFKTQSDYSGFNGLLYDFSSSQSSVESPRDNLINCRNIQLVKINSTDRLSVGLRPMRVTEIRDELKRFISNPYDDPNYPEKVTVVKTYNGKDYEFQVSKGMISIQSDRGSSYYTYLIVYNEIIGAFNEMRDNESLRVFGKKFVDLSEGQQKIIEEVIPYSISLDEPEAFGTEPRFEVDEEEAIPYQLVEEKPSFQGAGNRE